MNSDGCAEDNLGCVKDGGIFEIKGVFFWKVFLPSLAGVLRLKLSWLLFAWA